MNHSVAEQAIAEIMHKDPVTVAPGDDVRTVIERLREHELAGVPVVDAAGRVVGMVTESDLVLEDEQAQIHLPHFVDILGGIVFLEPLRGFEQRLRKAFAARVEDMMTTDVVTVAREATVREAAHVMSEHHHNRLPVVDGDGKLAGVVTRLDILRALSA